MEKQRGQVKLETLFPEVPPTRSREFTDYLRRTSRRVVVATGLAVVILMPLIQAIEGWFVRPAGDYALDHLALRLPVFLLAAVVLGLWYFRPEGTWPRPLALLLGVLLLSSATARFSMELAAGSPWVFHGLSLLLILIMIVAVLATRGLRDLILIYGIPTAGFAVFIVASGTDLAEMASFLVYCAVAMLVAGYIAHILYSDYIENFLMQCQLREHALTDPLTGLLNRRAMQQELEIAQAAARRHERSFAVLMADIDFFKRVNDTHGHDVGDQVLAELSDRITQSIRTEDRASRWGGEEFLVLLNTADSSAAVTVAEKLRLRVAETPFSTDAGPLEITVSLGVAVHCRDEDLKALIVRADAGLYRAKHSGRNCSVLDTPETPSAPAVPDTA